MQGSADFGEDNGVSRHSSTVLHIEDNLANLRLVSQLCARSSYIELLEAREPEVALQLARDHQPALVLMDLNLPGMNGFEVLALLRATAGLERTPVVAITANAMASERERGLAAGFSDYLTKPLDIKRFESVLASWLSPGPESPTG